MQIPHHPLRGGQASGSEAGQLPPAAAAAVGWVDTHRAQTCPLATQGCSTGKKVGVKEAGCEGGKGGNVFTGVCGGRGWQADAWFQVWVHLCRLFFGKGANVVYRNSSQREIWSLAMVL